MTRRTFPPPSPPEPEAPRVPILAAVMVLLAVLGLWALTDTHARRAAVWADCERVCAPAAPWVSGDRCWCDVGRRAP